MLLSTDSLIVDEAAQIQNLNYTKLPQGSCQNVLGAQFVVLFWETGQLVVRDV